MLQLMERRLFCSSLSHHVLKPLRNFSCSAQLVKENDHDDSDFNQHDERNQRKCKNQFNERNINTEYEDHYITFCLMNDFVFLNVVIILQFSQVSSPELFLSSIVNILFVVVLRHWDQAKIFLYGEMLSTTVKSF